MLDFFLEFKFVFTALAWGSLALFITSIAIMPWLIAKIPADYFCMQRHTPARLSSRPLPSRVLAYVRNVFGCTLVVLGIVMLLLPGQGILTILAGPVPDEFSGQIRARVQAGRHAQGAELAELDSGKSQKATPNHEPVMNQGGIFPAQCIIC